MITCGNVFNVWPKSTLLLPVWPRGTKRLDPLTVDLSVYVSVSHKSHELRQQYCFGCGSTSHVLKTKAEDTVGVENSKTSQAWNESRGMV